MPAFLLIVLVPYLLLNYYVGSRLWQYIFCHVLPGWGKAFWPLFWLIAATPLASRIKTLPVSTQVRDFLAYSGDYWLAALYYFFLIWLVADFGGFLARRLGLLTAAACKPLVVGLASAALVAVLLAYGSWNARNPRVATYDVTIAKPAAGLAELRVVMVSDIHLGPIVGYERLKGLVAAINDQQPDLVLMPGDIIDENVTYFVERKMSEPFRALKPRFGVWAVFGNHEYISGKAEEVAARLREAGITVLRDEYVKVGDSFYIVGRDDRRSAQFGGRARHELAMVMAGVDRRLPILLMDHQPYDLEEAAVQGVDLQLSGHTHVGQMFPNSFVTGRMFEVDWGYLRKGAYQVIVSSGFGTWGPPIRIGNRPEIVAIKIRFAEQPQ
ncbi:metallophosphoesterase [Anaeroselena agilis]|uniref:Metallophosphoesterase n=1 Tax=Anaeroselena agilis TaxID=3063788 RepID=A0ABU3NSV9_9FIRM|nr:metallophosphoesterase [Selenomonadales bacterium 4137-cl]